MENELPGAGLATGAWVALAAWVIGYDVWAMAKGKRTLSGAWWSAAKHRPARYALMATWLGITWHLLAGDRKWVSDEWSRKYRSHHPLWVAADRIKERNGRVIITSSAPLTCVAGGE